MTDDEATTAALSLRHRLILLVLVFNLEPLGRSISGINLTEASAFRCFIQLDIQLEAAISYNLTICFLFSLEKTRLIDHMRIALFITYIIVALELDFRPAAIGP